VRIHYEPDVFRTTTVASVMQPPEPSVTGRDLAGATRCARMIRSWPHWRRWPI
jgi:hypothetical protein